MLRLPPRFTLFPYTTLFRSDIVQLDLANIERVKAFDHGGVLPLLISERRSGFWIATPAGSIAAPSSAPRAGTRRARSGHGGWRGDAGNDRGRVLQQALEARQLLFEPLDRGR